MAGIDLSEYCSVMHKFFCSVDHSIISFQLRESAAFGILSPEKLRRLDAWWTTTWHFFLDMTQPVKKHKSYWDLIILIYHRIKITILLSLAWSFHWQLIFFIICLFIVIEKFGWLHKTFGSTVLMFKNWFDSLQMIKFITRVEYWIIYYCIWPWVMN